MLEIITFRWCNTGLGYFRVYENFFHTVTHALLKQNIQQHIVKIQILLKAWFNIVDALIPEASNKKTSTFLVYSNWFLFGNVQTDNSEWMCYVA